MSEEEIELTAHGREQEIKIAIMQMINEARSPYEIILAMTDWLEKVSGEKGYSSNVRSCLHTVYGIGLNKTHPLQFALQEVNKRCKKLETSLKSVDDEDIKKRISFAIEHHKNFANFLKKKIDKAVESEN